jgi:hypothetical protein
MLRILIPALLLLLQPAADRLQGVVGLWSPHTDLESAIMTDGSKWSGQTTPETLAPIGKLLFGDATGAFLANGTSANAFPIAVDRETRDFRRGTVRVEFKLISGPTDQSAGIVIGMQPSGEYHFVRYNTKDGNIALWAFAAGERRVIAKGAGLKQLPLGAWHELVVRLEGVDITASVTGHPELDAHFTMTSPTSGRVGVWAKRDVVTAFRRFAVESTNR